MWCGVRRLGVGEFAFARFAAIVAQSEPYSFRGSGVVSGCINLEAICGVNFGAQGFLSWMLYRISGLKAQKLRPTAPRLFGGKLRSIPTLLLSFLLTPNPEPDEIASCFCATCLDHGLIQWWCHCLTREPRSTCSAGARHGSAWINSVGKKHEARKSPKFLAPDSHSGRDWHTLQPCHVPSTVTRQHKIFTIDTIVAGTSQPF